MLRVRLLPTLLAATPLLFSACESAPDYSVEPVIEFKSIKAERGSTGGGTEANLVTVTIKYKDGDGDLGLSAEDRQNAPFKDTTPSGGNEYYNNYHITMYWATPTGNFQPYPVTQSLNYNGAFERLLTGDAKPQPIRGEINYTPGGREASLPILDPEFAPGNRLKFDIYIYDRALHKSNVITTDEVVLK